MKKTLSKVLVATMLTATGVVGVSAADTVTTGNSTSNVINAEGTTEAKKMEVVLNTQRMGDDIVVIVTIPKTSKLKSGAFTVTVPKGLEYKNSMEGSILADSESTIDAVQNEDGSISVEFSKNDAVDVEGELLGLIFTGSNKGGDFTIEDKTDNNLTTGEGVTTITGKGTLATLAEPAQATNKDKEDTKTDTTSETKEDTKKETTSTTKEDAKKETTSEAKKDSKDGKVKEEGQTDKETGKVKKDTTEAETGLASNILALALLSVLCYGVIAVKNRKEG